MSSFAMQDLLEAGMHFGHLTRRWNPKMKPYIYGVRNGVHIIDLSKTARQLKVALEFIAQAVGEGRDVLFVGTKRQAQDIIADEAKRAEMYYINKRWLGGMLTNWKTIKASINRLNDLQKKKEDGTFESLNKKELLMVDREIEKLLHSLGGIQQLSKPPGLMVVVDPKLEHIALHEAKLLGIPVVALADTNCDPDNIDHLVPGNDDALRSIELFLKLVADQVLAGLKLRETRSRQEAQAKREKAASEKAPVREVEVGGAAAGAYVGDRKETSDEAEAAEGQYSAKAPEAPASEAAGEESSEESPAASSSEAEAVAQAAESAESTEPAAETAEETKDENKDTKEEASS